MRLVLVEWLDSLAPERNWRLIEDVGIDQARPLSIRSVGWLLKDGDECKVLVPHLSEETHPTAGQQGCGDMTIPTRSILRIVDLEIPAA